MCDRCLDIDYPIADVWRPCYVPRTRAQQQARPYTPGEDDFLAQTVIDTLRWQRQQDKQTIGRLVAENEALRGRKTSNSGTFEAIVVNE